MPRPSMSHRQGGGGSPDEAPAPKKSKQRRGMRAPDAAGTHPDLSPKEWMMVKTPMRTETEQAKKGPRSPIAIGKVNLLLAFLALLVLAGAYWVGVLPALLPEALALLILTLSLLTVASRAWYARRGGLEYELLRYPFRRELR